jgi:EpsI family protein
MKVGLLALLLAGIYHSTLTWLEAKDWGRADYSYGYIIPLVALYLVWEKRRELTAQPASPAWAGLAALLAGLALYWLGELAGEFFTLYISFWLVLVSLCWINLGWAKLKSLAFALVILLAMFPPPHFINDGLTLRLKLISSQLGVAILQMYGMSAFREGNVIDLGFTQLQVVDACSGLRYLFPLLIMGLLLAYFYKAALWKKAILVASTVPLTIATNSLRIAATGILYEIWGPAAAEDFFHGFSGWLIFIFGLAMLLLEMAVLKRLPGEKNKNKFNWLGLFDWSNWLKGKREGQFNSLDSSGSLPSVEPIEPIEPTKPIGPAAASGWKALLHPPQFVVAVILLMATLGLAQGVEFREKIPPAKSFASFPLQVGEWSGKRERMDQIFVDELDLSDYVIVDYVNGGRGVNFYTAYYESQRKGESIHSPETCLPGSGWEFRNAGSLTLPLADRRGGPMRVNKAFMVKGNSQQLAYFWFPQRDRVLTNAWELKLYNFWDALTRQRTDGALVRVITPVYPNETINDADKRLAAFTKEIVPVLNEFLPK